MHNRDVLEFSENLRAIIHMNGRVYDPKLGRMLSPDPVTQAPENGQNYNRYSYANNNPLRYTDPSGFSFQDCATAIAYEGTDVVADVYCAITVFKTVKSLVKEFDIFGGNGCDKTCKARRAAHNWCKAQSTCLAELRANTREKYRRRSAQVIFEATQTGQSYYFENGRAHLGDNTGPLGGPRSQVLVIGQNLDETDAYVYGAEDSLMILQHFYRGDAKHLTVGDMTDDSRILATMMYNFAAENATIFGLLGGFLGVTGSPPRLLALILKFGTGLVGGMSTQSEELEEALEGFNDGIGDVNVATRVKFRPIFNDLFSAGQ